MYANIVLQFCCLCVYAMPNKIDIARHVLKPTCITFGAAI